MAVQSHPYAIILAISALTTLLASIVILRRNVPGTTELGAVLLNLFIWSSSYALIWWLVDLSDKILWLKIMYIGVVSVPPLFLAFILRITNQSKWLTNRNILLLIIEPSVMLLCVWLRIEWVFSRIWLEDKGAFGLLQLDRGPGFWINTFYSYAIILLALLVLWHSAMRANSFFRRQYLILLMASTMPLAANLLSQLSFHELKGLDLTPISFGVLSAVYMYVIYQYQFIELLPVARGRLIENMSDGVLVLDKQGRVLDLNPALKNFLENASASLIGRNVSDVFREWQHNADPIMSGIETRTELKIPHSPTRYMDLRVTNLYDEQQKFNGRLIVFRDVTDRKEVERDLRRANDRLQTQLIEIGMLQSQLREQAIRDALTNVFNRRYLEETLERELSRAERENYPLSVIMMDLDFFKDVNDTYGHEAGDVVLKTLAETVMRQSRHGDFVCRYGGEEFALVMPNIPVETAKQRADNLHHVVEALQIPYGVFNLTTTISMGVAMYPEHGKTKEDLLRAADRAMYIAKHTGRNRVVIYEETQMSAD